jgi:hypothetical protein
LALGLIPAAALAAPLPISSVEQVSHLCQDLRAKGGPAKETALKQEFLLRLAPGQFQIAESDPETGTLTVDTSRSFRFFKGQVVLYPVDEEDLDLTLLEGQAMPASTGDMTLELDVRPGQDAEQPCYTGLAKDYVLGVEVLSARLVSHEGKVVAQLEPDESIDRAPVKSEGAPQVEVEPAQVEGSPQASAQLTENVKQLRPQLTECYQKGLARTPTLDGSLVLGFDLSPAGKPGEITVEADSVQDDAMSACVSGAVKGLTVSGAPAPAAKKGPPGTKVAQAETGSRASVVLHFGRK